MNKTILLTLVTVTVFACERSEPTDGTATGTVAPPQAQPVAGALWTELDLTLEQMTTFCADEAKKEPKTKGDGVLKWPDPPTKEIETARWRGMLRYLHPLSGRTPRGEACFVNVEAASADHTHELASFEAKLGLPACDERFEYPTAVYCLVPEGDPSGLAMWQARFTQDQKLSNLGISTIGFSAARTEKTWPPNVVRPKNRPTREHATTAFTSRIARLEIDELGVTYDRFSADFPDLETPTIRSRFARDVEPCETSVGRCTFTSADTRHEALGRFFDQQKRGVSKKVRTPEDERLDKTLAIDAESSTPWAQMEWAVRAATTQMARVLFVADGPRRGSLPTFSHVSPSEPVDDATPRVDEVPEPDGSDRARTVALSTDEVVLTIDGASRSFAAGDGGFDWAAIHAALVELVPKEQVRPKLALSAAPDVTWEQVFRLVEIAAQRDDGSRLYDVTF